jgi:hypothetical protein
MEWKGKKEKDEEMKKKTGENEIFRVKLEGMKEMEKKREDEWEKEKEE